MLGFLDKKKKIREALQKDLSHEDMGEVAEGYQETLAYLKNVFRDNDPIIFRELLVGGAEPKRICLVFCGGLADAQRIDNF